MVVGAELRDGPGRFAAGTGISIADLRANPPLTQTARQG